MNKKRILYLLAFMVFLCTMLCSNAFAADGVSFLHYDSDGHFLGEKTCYSYKTFGSNLIVSDWFDLNDTNGGWYVVSSNVIMGSNTTMRITGDVHLILCDGVTVSVGDGIYIKKGSSLSIYGQSKGTGKLVSKPDSGPGIGGMAGTVAGSLYIHGGQIEAKGGTNAAGIGGGNHSSGYQNIVIYGGKVNATGGSSAAGIGKGQQNSPGDCGLIAIYGGVVTATSSKYGAGIGGGEDRDGGTIRIYGGTVTATGGHDGAGIGGGEGGSGGNILIEGGEITAKGGDNGAGIGGGENGSSGGTIVINDGFIQAEGVGTGAGIGGGKNGSAGTITINGGFVYADGSDGAGIGSGSGGKDSGSVTINGGTVHAVASIGTAAGIGGGKSSYTNPPVLITGGTVISSAHTGIGSGQDKHQGGGVTITGGEIYATGDGGAGIGGGKYGSGGTIRISNALICAQSNIGAGIGGGGADEGQDGGNGGSITITDSVVSALSTQKGAGIGGGNGGNGGTISISGSFVLATGGYLDFHYLDSNQIKTSLRGPARGLQRLGGQMGAADMDSYSYNKIADAILEAIFSGTYGGSGIGGGDDGNGGSVTITDSTVYANAGRSTCASIGRGDGGKGDGSLTVDPGSTVRVGSSDQDLTRVAAAVRTASCRSHKYARIEACDHADCTYEVSETGHTKVCNHCLTVFEEEIHVYAEGVCEICGYSGGMVTVTYAAGNEHATGEMAPDSYVPSSTHLLPGCSYEVSGYEFGGWRLNDTDEILPAGLEYTMNASMTLTATWRNSWSELQAEIDNTESGEVIILSSNTTASIYDSALTVPAGKTLTLDLNGCVLSRGMSSAAENGHVLTNNGSLIIMDTDGGGRITGGSTSTASEGGGIVNSGTLTLQSGSVTGNYGYMAGAVLNRSSAEFMMTGGTLEGNACGLGGGGAVVNYGTMTMTGGSITGNTSGQNGGGIWSNRTLTISGGTISNNTAADKGGGIYARGSSILALSGAPVIMGNSSSTRGQSNLHCSEDNGMLAVIRADALTDGIRVGLSSTRLPAADAPVTLVTGISGRLPGFQSDAAGYMIIAGDDALKLAAAPAFGTPDFIPPADLTAVEDEAFAGIASTVVDIPAGCMSVGDHAFSGCQDLVQIRIPADCMLGADVFDSCPLVYVYGAAGSPAQDYCLCHDNCIFIVAE